MSSTCVQCRSHNLISLLQFSLYQFNWDYWILKTCRLKVSLFSCVFFNKSVIFVQRSVGHFFTELEERILEKTYQTYGSASFWEGPNQDLWEALESFIQAEISHESKQCTGLGWGACSLQLVCFVWSVVCVTDLRMRRHIRRQSTAHRTHSYWQSAWSLR